MSNKKFQSFLTVMIAVLFAASMTLTACGGGEEHGDSAPTEQDAGDAHADDAHGDDAADDHAGHDHGDAEEEGDEHPSGDHPSGDH